MKNLQKNYPLFNETTFRIGGPAEMFVRVENRKDFEEVIKEANNLGLKTTIIGGGSNVLISSKGLEGLVIKRKGGEIDFLEKDLVRADAGVFLPDFSEFAYQNEFEGAEWAMGVPGTIGGAVYGNAGAFNQSISDTIEEVEVIEKNEKKILKKSEISFSYRNSTFKERDLVILSASFRLKKGKKDEIKEKTENFLSHRKNNHPIEKFSAGSIFKNPEIQINDSELIKKFPKLADFNQRGVIPAGYLIENVKMKGFEEGGAKVSEKHCNFIVNENNATSDDVKNLIKKIQERVAQKFKINLTTEIRYID